MEFNEVLRKAIAHKGSIDTSIKDIKNNTFLISKKETELSNLNDIYKTTKFSYSYLDALVKEESGKFIKRLNSILDYGVKSIFDDMDYSIEIRITENNKATIHLVYDEDGIKLDPDVKNCGGGIRSVIGILMQCFFIFHYKVEPIIFIDEGLSQISSQYVPNVFDLLNELAKKNSLKILLVTHDDRFLDYADKRYTVDEGKANLVVKKGGVESGSDSDTVTE